MILRWNSSLITLFSFSQCTASSSTSSLKVFGTCLSTSECNDKGGSADGNCAAGFGVCCTFLANTCGSTVSQNCTYVQNPSYPSAYTTAGSCEYSVMPLNSDICQLRLDLDTFTLTDNVVGGACIDSFDVTVGSSRTYQTLCGTNSGYHGKF